MDFVHQDLVSSFWADRHFASGQGHSNVDAGFGDLPGIVQDGETLGAELGFLFEWLSVSPEFMDLSHFFGKTILMFFLKWTLFGPSTREESSVGVDVGLFWLLLVSFVFVFVQHCPRRSALVSISSLRNPGTK